jgi:hypothetical protein
MGWTPTGSSLKGPQGDDGDTGPAGPSTGAAGGSLSGSYPNPGIAAGAVGGTEVASAIKDPAAATPGLRTLGTSSTSAAAGNDTRLSNARTPTAHASSHAPGSTDPITLPLVISAPYSKTYAGSLALDPTLGNYPYTTATGNITALSIGAGGVAGQDILHEVLASSADRTVTLSGVGNLSNIPGPYIIPSGKVGLFLYRYLAVSSAWCLIHFDVTT